MSCDTSNTHIEVSFHSRETAISLASVQLSGGEEQESYCPGEGEHSAAALFVGYLQSKSAFCCCCAKIKSTMTGFWYLQWVNPGLFVVHVLHYVSLLQNYS